ncbi:cytochrome c and c1 heme-lyase [Rhizophagus irregularis]|uniref:Holocytochrome c-type synthase n=3 Tax=Rhizophagus irregularis TaxID=588596 RepID=A0A2I1DUZ1_9GLOM|nr:cytochrome c/c1 heme-lyase [Rhizophagus irregularis DAOM 181602=DAOM 197198]EXX78646.1 cytochrome c1 heme lyase CYT2 [Rhizophagus irregularis DAOM 197198w]PKC17339.1 cytochrome c and c1 heme-lyase [Rhizophagus irregularis]EXX78647.1 cytochrome c1 heme lyase CYT2 [Rhizophagus irregularis DAOM 197198w]PKC71189.1 cytochrome c and c1 heme-lyase [Rhizophagus irregularis]PKY13669.1 cytochrome c and c1 heme-lyase [Rhizophagus irregularis]|eukprot:XP_025185694.1 cytochrome c/c1 heme-lyase [Rhizophagus irregularis DAOM 181602=DAOM 197198]
MQDTSSTNSTGASSCPVNHSAWSSFIPPNTEKGPASQHVTNLQQCPASSTNMQPPDQKNLQDTTNSEREGCGSDSLINESNNMPLHPNQKPTKGQRIPLSTTRELSNIPRVLKNKNNAESESANDGNEEKVWIYPSEQMFFNAMKRKNWNPREEDMRVVIPMHNAVNEKAWKEILEWEKLHENKCGGPKLVKFQGKVNNITPKARLLNLLGYKLPFDRHDWVVDRCGKQVTYVIDFYSGQPDPKFPQAVSFYLDVRPALTFDGALHRLRRWTNDLKMNWMN